MIEMFLDGYVAFVEEQKVRNIGDSIGLAELRVALSPHIPLHRSHQLALHLLAGVDSSYVRFFQTAPSVAFSNRATDLIER